MRSTAKNHPLETRVARALSAAGVGDAARLVIGVSGGPDSTALLSILASIALERRFDLHACIVDHGIRPREEREGDISFVAGISRALGLSFHVRSVAEGECESRAVLEKKSLEEIAREKRLGLLGGLASEIGAHAVVLGHTRDDQVETVLMRLLNGSGITGLSGITLRRGLFVRPLLSCGKSEILTYLESKNLKYRIDSTNSETSFLRNRVRALLIPVLERSFPGYRTGLLSLARKLSLYDDFLAKEASKRLIWKKTRHGYRIDAHAFFETPAALRIYSLLDLYDITCSTASPRRLPFRFLTPLLDANPHGKGVLLRGHGVRVRVDGDNLVWEGDIVTRGEKSYFIAVEPDGSYTISGADIRVYFTYGSCSEAGAGDGKIGVSAIHPPLVLRSKRKGDELLLPSGRKTIKELFCDWKVPDGKKWEIPLLSDRSGVLAVLGGAFGYATRVRAGAGSDGLTESVVIRVDRGAHAL